FAKELLATLQREADPVVIDWPEYNHEAMGCGLEDRGITDRYEAMHHGWECALERFAERIPENLYEHPLLPVEDNTHGFSIWLDREQWGAVIDGLMLERERSDSRKKANEHSKSDARSAMCIEVIEKINQNCAITTQPLPVEQSPKQVRILEEALEHIATSPKLAGSSWQGFAEMTLKGYRESMPVE